MVQHCDSPYNERRDDAWPSFVLELGYTTLGSSACPVGVNMEFDLNALNLYSNAFGYQVDSFSFVQRTG